MTWFLWLRHKHTPIQVESRVDAAAWAAWLKEEVQWRSAERQQVQKTESVRRRAYLAIATPEKYRTVHTPLHSITISRTYRPFFWPEGKPNTIITTIVTIDTLQMVMGSGHGLRPMVV